MQFNHMHQGTAVGVRGLHTVNGAVNLSGDGLNLSIKLFLDAEQVVSVLVRNKVNRHSEVTEAS